jgi:hypothetical protein
MDRVCSTHGAKRNAYSILDRKPERKRSLGRRRHRWEDDIKIYVRYMMVLWNGAIWLRIGTSGMVV